MSDRELSSEVVEVIDAVPCIDEGIVWASPLRNIDAY